MSTPKQTSPNDPVKRKSSFSFKSPETKDKKEEKSKVKQRSENKPALCESGNGKPQQNSEPALSARKPATSTTSSNAPITTTTSTSSTTTTSASTSTTKTAANGGAVNTNDGGTSDTAVLLADTPRESWLHYNTSNEKDPRAAIAVRGAQRHVELRAMGEAFKGSAPEFLFRGIRKPTLWLKQFCAEVAPVWSEVRQAIQLESKNPEIQRACTAPAKNMDLLEKAFSRILKSWAGQGQNHVKACVSLAAKAMCAEMTHAYKVASSGASKFRNPAIIQQLIVDLLVCSLVEAKDAPSPLTAMFGNYLAALLENPPMQPDLFSLGDGELAIRLNSWSVVERFTYADFDPKDVFLSHTATPLQKFELPPTSEKFLEQSKEPLANLESFHSMRGMDGGSGDPGLIAPLKREFKGSGSWHEIRAGQLVDISQDPQAMKNLFNKYPLQAALAQFCCTQGFHQTGLTILLGGVKEKTLFTDLAGRPVAPKLSSYVPKWTIERKNDDALEVTCALTSYREQVDLIARDSDSKDTLPQAARLILPGWFEMIFKVSINAYGVLKTEQLSCSAYNFHLLEGMPEGSPLPAPEEELSKSESKSALKSLKRLSMKFKAAPQFDASPRTESTEKRDSPPKKPKPKEKAKEKEKD